MVVRNVNAVVIEIRAGSTCLYLCGAQVLQAVGVHKLLRELRYVEIRKEVPVDGGLQLKRFSQQNGDMRT